MNEGTKLLLQRMESHPQEFYYDYTSDHYSQDELKWAALLGHLNDRADYMKREAAGESVIDRRKALPFMPDDEVELLRAKWESLQTDAFAHSVMRTIVAGGPNKNAPSTGAVLTQAIAQIKQGV